MIRQSSEVSKNEKQALSHAGSGLLILMAAFCTLGAVVSAFSLPVEMIVLFWVCLFSTIIITAVTVIYRGKGLLMLMIPAFVLFLFFYNEIVDGGMWAINEITTQYSRWLPLPALFPEAKGFIDNPGVFISALGVVVTFLLVFSIYLRRSTFVTILVTSPLIFLTFVITNLQPGLVYMFGLIAVYLTLLISSAYSPDNYAKRGRIYIPAFIIAIILMLIAYMFAPQGSYTREEHIATLGNRFRTVVSQVGRFGNLWNLTGRGNWGFGWFGTYDSGIWQFNTQNVDIADSGMRVFSDHSLLEITVNEPGTFYLRGYTMQHFDGRSWINNEEPQLFEEVVISWPSIFRDTSAQQAYDFQNQILNEGELLHKIALLRQERRDIMIYAVIRDINDEELRSQFSNEEELIAYLNEQYIIQELRAAEIDLEMTALINELYALQNYEGEQTRRVDIGRTMPALIAELYALFGMYDISKPVEMEINRTGDLSSDISYHPYYGGTFIGENDMLNNEEVFYYVDGSMYRLTDILLEEIFSFDSAMTITPRTSTAEVTFDGETMIITDTYSTQIYERFDDRTDAVQKSINSLGEAMTNYATRMQRLGYYTEIDPLTKAGLRQIAFDAGISPLADRAVIADAVANYVATSSVYTLMPGYIPEDEDFALYFLQEQQGGYCVHFTTAAVLMLRALDIPARFTTGYVVTVPPGDVGRTVVLTDRNAHAWVEVFYDDIGWLYLEVTPSGGNPYIPEPRPHTHDFDTDVLPTPPPMVPDDFIDRSDEDDFGPWDDTNGNTDNTGTGDNEYSFLQLPPVILNLVIAFICLVLITTALITRRSIARNLRTKHFEQENTNKAVIYMWRYIQKLSRREVAVPIDIEELALKARFSQHQMTEEERAEVMKYADKIASEMRSEKKGFARFWLKYLRALC